MDAKKFSDAMSEIDNKYADETIQYKKIKKNVWVRPGAIAACLAIAAVAAFSILPGYINQQDVTPQDNPNHIAADNPRNGTPPTTSEIHISMDNLFFNDIANLLDTARKWYDPELYDFVAWDKEQVIRYYGKDLTSIYVPDGLLAAAGNGTTTVIAEKEGNIVMDTVWLNFYHEYYEDGSPKLSEEVTACKGFSLMASKVGLLNDCIYLLPENETKTSDIGGTSVTFGYRAMPYGPYDPETHEPSGYYDMYVAEFEQGEIEYQIVAEQMEAEKLVKVVSSIICGKDAIIDMMLYHNT